MTLVAGQLVNSYSEASMALNEWFAERFPSDEIPVQYGNRALLQNGTRTLANYEDSELWVRFEVINTTSSSPEITRSFTKITGFVSVNVFTKNNKGSRAADEVADRIFEIFNRQNIHGIITQTPQIQVLPPNNAWYQVNVTVPFTWQRCTA